MNQILKNFGILLILLGVVILLVYMMNTPVGNGLLVLSGFLMVGGIVAHVILNRIIE
ncbi:hypothetical protein [Carboxylicivirga caseinilyticus]|uniref:hypothetical protein n=1 Tax=Carboxylicivirga caseinilyticus TaxID=3417572 RepID=UPI003D32AB4C|nr:hypothetical protein [Marinilabiliaceae bacterium A049]